MRCIRCNYKPCVYTQHACVVMCAPVRVNHVFTWVHIHLETRNQPPGWELFTLFFEAGSFVKIVHQQFGWEVTSTPHGSAFLCIPSTGLTTCHDTCLFMGSGRELGSHVEKILYQSSRLTDNFQTKQWIKKKWSSTKIYLLFRQSYKLDVQKLDHHQSVKVEAII